jgi:hypothetical protein
MVYSTTISLQSMLETLFIYCELLILLFLIVIIIIISVNYVYYLL